MGPRRRRLTLGHQMSWIPYLVRAGEALFSVLSKKPTCLGREDAASLPI